MPAHCSAPRGEVWLEEVDQDWLPSIVLRMRALKGGAPLVRAFPKERLDLQRLVVERPPHAFALRITRSS
jgi:hypothetical protein